MPKENITAGDLVLLADKNYPCGEWPIARVEEVFISSDGFVRAVQVKTASTVATHAKRQTTTTTTMYPMTTDSCQEMYC